MLLLTLGATIAAFIKLPTTYQATSSIVFLAPRSVAKSYGGNTYLAFNSTLNQTADVVRYRTNDVRTASQLAAQGDTSTYLVTDATDTSGPVLLVTVTGSNKADVERTLSGVTNQVTAGLAAIQSGLSRNDKITDSVITFNPSPNAMASKKLRPISVVGGVGLVLTIGIPIVVDAILLRRRPNAKDLPRDQPRDLPSERPESRPRDGLAWRIEGRDMPKAAPGEGAGAPQDASGNGEASRNGDKIAAPSSEASERRPSFTPAERSGRPR